MIGKTKKSMWGLLFLEADGYSPDPGKVKEGDL